MIYYKLDTKLTGKALDKLAKLLEEQSETEGMSKSGFIENILKEKIKKKNE